MEFDGQEDPRNALVTGLNSRCHCGREGFQCTHPEVLLQQLVLLATITPLKNLQCAFCPFSKMASDCRGPGWLFVGGR